MEPVVDYFHNLRSPDAVEVWRNEGVLKTLAENFRNQEVFELRDSDVVLTDMDQHGVDIAVLTGIYGQGMRIRTRNYDIDQVLTFAHAHPDRFRAAMLLEGLESIATTCRKIEEIAADPLFVALRIVPLLYDEPPNGPRFYPLYERCEELDIPVSINVGIPGPRVRARHQQPLLLDDIMIDFPNLTVVATHMGHPWESTLIRLMRKYPNLYLCNSAYLADRMDPRVIQYMQSRSGIGKVVFGSDAPTLPLGRAVNAANRLEISPKAREAFMSSAAVGLIKRTGTARSA